MLIFIRPQAVQPTAGNIVYDQFSDDVNLLSGLKSRLSHLQPAEVLYPQGVSRAVENSFLEWKRYR